MKHRTMIQQKKQIQEFDWKQAFPKCNDSDGSFTGFDVVIGNPPYISGKQFGKNSESEKRYYHKNFKTAEYQLDLYQLFIEKAQQICKPNGHISLIVPNTWLANNKTVKTRDFILNKLTIQEITFSQKKIFKEANVDVIIFLAENSNQNTKISINEIRDKTIVFKHKRSHASFKTNENSIFDIHVTGCDKKLLQKIEQKSQPLSTAFQITRGIHAYRRDGFGKSKFGNGFQTAKDYNKQSYHSNIKDDETFKPELKGRHIFPYFIQAPDEYVSYGKWLAEPRDETFFQGDRIYIRIILGKKRLIASIIDKNQDFIANQSVAVAKPKSNTVPLELVVAQLNSKLMAYYFRLKHNEFDNIFPKIKMYQLKQLPVITKNRKINQQIINKVQQITALKNKTVSIDTHQLEKQIDDLIYQLYDLSREEIRSIETKISE